MTAVVIALMSAGCTDILVGGMASSPERDTVEKTSESDSESGFSGDSDSGSAGDADTGDGTGSETDSDTAYIIEICAPVDNYDSLGTVCYIDSIAGDDDNSGLSPDAPLKTQDAIGSDCVVARFKRGSRFDESLKIQLNVEAYTHYGDDTEPLPQFVVPNEPMSGPVVQSLIKSITLDGLYIAGARSDGEIENILGGICVFLGEGSKVLNSEITDCEIGAMLAGEGALFQGNYVHDMVIGVVGEPTDDPNAVGGAEGVFVTASNVEVAYNTFINCSAPVQDETGSCDGGATEIVVTACGTIADVKIHHNFSHNNCGFIEIATGFGECKGTFEASDIYQNVSIDSAWFGFLQVNNTDFNALRFFNNTAVQRENSYNAGRLWVIFTGTSSGMSGGDLLPGTVFLMNNFFVFDDVTTYGELFDPDFDQTTNLVIYTDEADPGFANIAGTNPEDFDLTGDSPAVDAGTIIPGNTLDFMNRRIVDSDGAADIGAFEFGTSQGACLPSRRP